MQLRGWGLTRTRVVILVVVSISDSTRFAPAAAAGCTDTGRSQAMAAFDAAVPLVIVYDASWRSSAVLGEHDFRTTLPDTAPLPRRLPRAPPAA